MNENELFDRIDTLSDLLSKKEQLDSETKANNEKIKKLKEELSEEMILAETPKIVRCGYAYTAQIKTKYNKKGNKRLIEDGVDYFETLRNEGLGDLIQETVNANSLNAAVANYVEENGELSDGLKKIIEPYEFYDISRRKN